MGLKRGQIAVKKRDLINHCESLHNCINTLDEIMGKPESYDRAMAIAKINKAIAAELHIIEHEMLHIPVAKLGNKCILFKNK